MIAHASRVCACAIVIVVVVASGCTDPTTLANAEGQITRADLASLDGGAAPPGRGWSAAHEPRSSGAPDLAPSLAPDLAPARVPDLAPAGVPDLAPAGAPDLAPHAAPDLAGAPAPSTCPDDDGSSGAPAGAPQYPSLLSGYAAAINGAKGLGCKVAGVDYAVGAPAAVQLKDPTAMPLPSGCSLSGSAVTCTGNGIVISGWSFALHGGMQLAVSGANIVITGNQFAVGSSCLMPLSVRSAGAVTITQNTIDGGGPLCNGLVDGFNGLVSYVVTAAGALVTIEHNWLRNIPEDGIDFRGPSAGAATIIEKFNLLDLQGWTGHPDGIQLNGGNFASSFFSHNTYRNLVRAGSFAGVQPIHIEAQLTAAISNFAVSFNTVVAPGTCNGGVNYPTGCSVNYDIACKSDGTGDSNVGFLAFGNYLDATGAVAGLLAGGGCQSPRFGSPYANYDMLKGTTE
jgi:hypothetical protein